MKKLFTISLLILTLSLAAAAQSSDDKNEVSAWGGYSPDSMTAARFAGRVPDARFGIFALRYARRIHDGDSVKIRYTVDAIPASFLSYPDIKVVGPGPTGVVATRETRYAWGVSPAGFQFNFRNKKKYQPFVEATGGMLFYHHIVPNFYGTKLNFTLSIGGGVEIEQGDGKSFTVGYKSLHISNANRGVTNPGFQNNLFYVGYKFHSW